MKNYAVIQFLVISSLKIVAWCAKLCSVLDIWIWIAPKLNFHHILNHDNDKDNDKNYDINSNNNGDNYNDNNNNDNSNEVDCNCDNNSYDDTVYIVMLHSNGLALLENKVNGCFYDSTCWFTDSSSNNDALIKKCHNALSYIMKLITFVILPEALDASCHNVSSFIKNDFHISWLPWQVGWNLTRQGSGLLHIS